MYRILVGSISIAVISSCFTGCLSTAEWVWERKMERRYPATDVSSQIEMWGGYEPQGTYELLVDTFIQSEDLRGGILVLEPIVAGRCNGFYSTPFTIFDYELNRDKWPKVKGVVDRGTLIKATRVVSWSEPGGHFVNVLGEVLGGPFTGKEVYLTECTNRWNATGPDIPYEFVLRKVDINQGNTVEPSAGQKPDGRQERHMGADDQQ